MERYVYEPEGRVSVYDGSGTSIASEGTHDWRYLFGGGRRDGQDLYYLNGQQWDYLTGGPLTHDPVAYWTDQLAITPPSLSFYDRAVVTTVPIVVGVGVTVLTGGFGAGVGGAIIAGGLGGLTGGATAGFSNAYAGGASIRDSFQAAGYEGAIGGTLGGVGGRRRRENQGC